MLHWLSRFTRPQSITNTKGRPWQPLLWREWRNCEDEEYARHLFALLVDEPAGGWAIAVLGLLGTLYGVLGGWLIGLLRYWPEANAGLLSKDILIGTLLGGTAGLLLGLGLRRSGQLTWGAWLQGLIPTVPLIELPQLFPLPLFFRLLASLTSGIGVGLTGAVFFGQAHPPFYSLLAGLVVVVIVAGSGEKYWKVLVETFIFGPVGLLFGLLFGLGFAQLIGQIAGPFDVLDSARLVGLGVGLGAGLLLGQGSGLLGGMAWQVLVTGLVWLGGSNLVLIGWLAGLLIGTISGGAARMVTLAPSKLTFDRAYFYRRFYLWWSRRPPAAEVEDVLYRQASDQVWQEPLRLLSAQRQQLASAEELWDHVLHSCWVDRLIGRHTLVTLGNEALPQLLNVASTTTPFSRRVAVWLIRSIGAETTARLAGQTMICPQCLTGCGPHQVQAAGGPVTYYGCRICGQSRQFLDCSQGVVAVLDAGWKQTRRYHAGLLRVNWLKRLSLFDFDRVEILQATDEEVERFAVQIGNDTDPVRRRYARIACLVAAECQLSENTWRVLQRTFGVVKRGEGERGDKSNQ